MRWISFCQQIPLRSLFVICVCLVTTYCLLFFNLSITFKDRTSSISSERPGKSLYTSTSPISSKGPGMFLNISYAIHQTKVSPSISCAGRNIELVICVPVEPDGAGKREAIRLTWGSYATNGVLSKMNSTNTTTNRDNDPKKLEHSGEVILLFFLGSASPTVKGLQKRIEEEARVYGDIFQEDFLDTYKNLTLKSISLIKWVSNNCPNTRFVAKVDDDMYVNIPLLLNKLRTQALSLSGKNPSSALSIQKVKHNSYPPFMIGYKFFNATVIRENSSKWYTSTSAYRDKVYPHYLSGTAYAMSGSAALRLNQVFLKVPFFWLEDIYITGMCAKAAKIFVIGDRSFSFKKVKADGCQFKKLATAHGYTTDEMKIIHKQLLNPLIKCK